MLKAFSPPATNMWKVVADLLTQGVHMLPRRMLWAIVIGEVIVFVWEKWNRKNSDSFAIPIASGLVAGESLIAALIAIACALVGFLAVR